MLCCDPVVDLSVSCDLVVIVFCPVFLYVDPVFVVIEGQPRVFGISQDDGHHRELVSTRVVTF